MKKTILALILWGVATATPSRADIMAQITLVTTDLLGNPISSIESGMPFLLEATVQDVRDPMPDFNGVFAAYVNVDYEADFASIAAGAPFTFGPTFQPPLSPSHNTSIAGQILSAGVVRQNLTSPGDAPQLLWTVPVTAGAPGDEAFMPYFDPTFGHELLLYGYDFALLESEIHFIGANITVVPEPSSSALAALGVVGLIAWRSRRAQFCGRSRT